LSYRDFISQTSSYKDSFQNVEINFEIIQVVKIKLAFVNRVISYFYLTYKSFLYEINKNSNYRDFRIRQTQVQEI